MTELERAEVDEKFRARLRLLQLQHEAEMRAIARRFRALFILAGVIVLVSVAVDAWGIARGHR